MLLLLLFVVVVVVVDFCRNTVTFLTDFDFMRRYVIRVNIKPLIHFVAMGFSAEQ